MIVRLQAGETERVEALAAALGVAEPVVDGALRSEAGACVFLDTAGLCRIHATAGIEAKPLICRQYPLVKLDAPDGARWGVDPGCYHAMFQEGAPLAAIPMAAPASAAVAAPDDALAAMIRSAPDVGAALGALVGERPVRYGLPAAVLDRFVVRLAAVPWSELLPRAGSTAAAALRPLQDTPISTTNLRSLPPAWDRGAREGMARLVELRLATRTFGAAPVVALLGLAGALVLGAVVPDDPAEFSVAFAAWTRVLRAPALRVALVPDSATMAWLATGAGA